MEAAASFLTVIQRLAIIELRSGSRRGAMDGSLAVRLVGDVPHANPGHGLILEVGVWRNKRTRTVQVYVEHPKIG